MKIENKNNKNTQKRYKGVKIKIGQAEQQN